MWKDHPMLSRKEIEEYVHGQVRSPEKQQFTFSEVKKIGDALTMRWHTLTDFTGGEPRLTGKIARAAKVVEAAKGMSRLRTGSVRTISAMKRNILLILLFLVVFAVMFVLDARQAPANPRHALSRSNSTVVHEVVKRP